jgi:hypothetical protein
MSSMHVEVVNLRQINSYEVLNVAEARASETNNNFFFSAEQIIIAAKLIIITEAQLNE